MLHIPLHLLPAHHDHQIVPEYHLELPSEGPSLFSAPRRRVCCFACARNKTLRTETVSEPANLFLANFSSGRVTTLGLPSAPDSYT